MRWLLISWHRWCIAVSREEIDDRTDDGSACDVWTCRELMEISRREKRIAQLEGCSL